MRNAADYLSHIKPLIALNRQVMRWEAVREDAQGSVGLFRYQLTLRDGSLFEILEHFQIAGEQLQVTKYSFHWQSADGRYASDGTARHTTQRCRPIRITFTSVEMKTCWRTNRSVRKRCWLSSQRR